MAKRMRHTPAADALHCRRTVRKISEEATLGRWLLICRTRPYRPQAERVLVPLAGTPREPRPWEVTLTLREQLERDGVIKIERTDDHE